MKAFDRDMRSEAFLGECLTNAKGEHKIEYSDEQFNLAEKQLPDLWMKVYTAKGKDALDRR